MTDQAQAQAKGTAVPVPATRKDVRNAILTAKPQVRIVSLFGQEVEVRQPSLQQILDFQSAEDTATASAHMLQKYLYMPGTNEKVFDEADTDAIKQLPFNEDMQNLQDTLNEMIGIKKMTEDEVKNSLGIPLT